LAQAKLKVLGQKLAWVRGGGSRVIGEEDGKGICVFFSVIIKKTINLIFNNNSYNFLEKQI